MAFTPPVWFGSLYWSQRDGDESDPDAPLLEIRPGEHDCTETALRRLWKQFEDAASWQRLFGEIIGPTYQVLEQAIGSVDQARYLSTAEGQQLDEIGALVGRARGSLSDDELYRLAIRADAATLFSSGTVPEIVEICRSLLGDEMRVVQIYPATVWIRTPDTTPGVVPLLADVLADDLLAAVVAGLLVTWDTAATGGWSSTTGTPASPARWSSSVGTAANARSFWSHAHALGS